jgi:hypothetical protein
MAGHDEKLTAAQKTELGEKRNWDATVDDQKRELVHWACNNLTEHAERSVYRDQQQWRPIWGRHAGDRRKAKVIGASYRGIHWSNDSDDRHAIYSDLLRRGNKVVAWRAWVNDDHRGDSRAATSRCKWVR